MVTQLCLQVFPSEVDPIHLVPHSKFEANRCRGSWVNNMILHRNKVIHKHTMFFIYITSWSARCRPWNLKTLKNWIFKKIGFLNLITPPIQPILSSRLASYSQNIYKSGELYYIDIHLYKNHDNKFYDFIIVFNTKSPLPC